LPDGRGAREKHAAARKPQGHFRAEEGHASLLPGQDFRPGNQPQGAHLPPRRCRQFIVSQVELPALGINHHPDAPAEAVRLGLGGKALGAAGAQQLHRARQLPALRQGNGQANAHVGARPEPNRQAFDLLAFEARLPQGLFDQPKRPGGAGSRLAGFAQNRRPGARPLRQHRHAALRGRKLKSQYLHT